MGFVAEFREFAVKGSVVDLAVGIVIGAAFGAIVKSLVDDIIMPVVGVLLGGADFSGRYVVLSGRSRLSGGESLGAAREAGATVLAYGQFLNHVLTFLIVAFAVFLLVKGINRLRRARLKGKAAAPDARPCPRCLTEIPRAATRCKACAADVPAVAP